MIKKKNEQKKRKKKKTIDNKEGGLKNYLFFYYFLKVLLLLLFAIIFKLELLLFSDVEWKVSALLNWKLDFLKKSVIVLIVFSKNWLGICPLSNRLETECYLVLSILASNNWSSVDFDHVITMRSYVKENVINCALV